MAIDTCFLFCCITTVAQNCVIAELPYLSTPPVNDGRKDRLEQDAVDVTAATRMASTSDDGRDIHGEMDDEVK